MYNILLTHTFHSVKVYQSQFEDLEIESLSDIYAKNLEQDRSVSNFFL